VDGLEQSLPRYPSAPQLKPPVKRFVGFPLEKASIYSSSSLSLQVSFNASMSIAFESQAGRLDWKRDDDEPAMGKKPVLPLRRKFKISMVSLIVLTASR
jgi:hypothetical protein